MSECRKVEGLVKKSEKKNKTHCLFMMTHVIVPVMANQILDATVV